MIDAREAVAKETAERWLGRTFTVPMSLRSEVMGEAQAERANDIRKAIFGSLPRLNRADLLDRCEAARQHLTATSKSMTWPTPKEIHDAFRETAPKGSTGEDGPVSEYVIESTAQWVRKFKDWPGYLERPVETAKALVERGELTREEILNAGFPRHLLKRQEWVGPEAVAEARDRVAEARRMDVGFA